jgi:hypothetical protein
LDKERRILIYRQDAPSLVLFASSRVERPLSQSPSSCSGLLPLMTVIAFP